MYVRVRVHARVCENDLDSYEKGGGALKLRMMGPILNTQLIAINAGVILVVLGLVVGFIPHMSRLPSFSLYLLPLARPPSLPPSHPLPCWRTVRPQDLSVFVRCEWRAL